MFPSSQSAAVVNFWGVDHNGLLLLLAAQVSYLRAGEARGIGGGGVAVKGGGWGLRL